MQRSNKPIGGVNRYAVGYLIQQFTRQRYVGLTAESMRTKLSIDEIRSSRIVCARLSFRRFGKSVPIQNIGNGTARTIGVHAHSVAGEVLLQGDAGKGRKDAWLRVRLSMVDDEKEEEMGAPPRECPVETSW
jgi:hypothetical protein